MEIKEVIQTLTTKNELELAIKSLDSFITINKNSKGVKFWYGDVSMDEARNMLDQYRELFDRFETLEKAKADSDEEFILIKFNSDAMYMMQLAIHEYQKTHNCNEYSEWIDAIDFGAVYFDCSVEVTDEQIQRAIEEEYESEIRNN